MRAPRFDVAVPASSLAVERVMATVIVLDRGHGPVQVIRLEQGPRLLGYFDDLAALVAGGYDLADLVVA